MFFLVANEHLWLEEPEYSTPCHRDNRNLEDLQTAHNDLAWEDCKHILASNPRGHLVQYLVESLGPSWWALGK